MWFLAEGAGLPALREHLRARFQRWLVRRIPPARSVTLDQRRIFIFPSRVGFFFFACLLVMLVAAINYENNMSYALTFLLATLFVIAVLHSYANLSGLTLRALRAGEGFPRQLVPFSIGLACATRRGHHALWLGFEDDPEAVAVSVMPERGATVTLYREAGERGPFRPGRLRVESRYPLGLLRCWTWVDLDLVGLAYPRPLPYPEPLGSGAGQPRGRPARRPGEDEFFGLRDYRAGDRLRQVYWKGLARGQTLQSKQYAAGAASLDWLDWDAFPGIARERRLSFLCQQCLDLHRRGRRFGLRLPGNQLAAGAGDGQRDRVLRALGNFAPPPEAER
ncbi:hypothetical protein HRUBRA_02636 [Pseudohaliea rubra DSM 19751]|uniref:Uncharacterized protein n=2 Tax=Pseudohaliea TaxID=1341120 RepID=A0A095VN40_9GAMM|nr:hypothetical protein HRUBRA_02636 [Pseudohaliea rubra DSM 19751]